MERLNTFWAVNEFYKDLKEFHFTTSELSFVGYFKNSELIFVIDNTCDLVSPNNLLLIESMQDTEDSKIKWDSILQKKFDIDSLKIRPKENTKYKKLDISYVDLSLYNEFIKLQTDDLYSKILSLREDLSLQNAFARESENLLHYNKSSQTLEKANITKQNLEKKILNVSKRLKKVQELEDSNSDKFDEVLKQTLVQKLYDNTEKLKRTERRIKRADKKVVILEEELSKNRIQIQELQKRIALRFKEKIDNTKKSLDNFVFKTPVNMEEKKELNTQILNAKNLSEEENLSSHDYVEESTMVKKEDIGLINENVEFKPPVASVEEPVKKETLKERFVKKLKSLDSKYVNIIKYVSFAVVILVISVLAFYAFMDSNNIETSDISSDQVAQQLKDQQIVNEEIPVVEGIKSDDLNVINKSSDLEKEQNLNENKGESDKELKMSENVQGSLLISGEDLKAEDSQSYSISNRDKTKTLENKVSLKTSEKKVKDVIPVKKKVITPKIVKSKKIQPAQKKELKVKVSAVKQSQKVNLNINNVSVENEISNEKESDKIKNESDILEEKEIHKDIISVSSFDIIKKEYVDNVLAGDKYISVIEDLQDSFFVMQDDSKISELNNMNTYWNKFRNMVYHKYYNSDDDLKDDINFDEYYTDEYLLRKYTNLYNDFFENIVNKFVMMYEYTNLSSVDLYDSIEKGLVELGKPSEKLELLLKIYTSISTHGGSDLVLSSILQKEKVVVPEDTSVDLVESQDSDYESTDSTVKEDSNLSVETVAEDASDSPDEIIPFKGNSKVSDEKNKISNVEDIGVDSILDASKENNKETNDDVNNVSGITENNISNVNDSSNVFDESQNQDAVAITSSIPVIVDEQKEVVNNEDKKHDETDFDDVEETEKEEVEVSSSEKENILETQTLDLKNDEIIDVDSEESEG